MCLFCVPVSQSAGEMMRIETESWSLLAIKRTPCRNESIDVCFMAAFVSISMLRLYIETVTHSKWAMFNGPISAWICVVYVFFKKPKKKEKLSNGNVTENARTCYNLNAVHESTTMRNQNNNISINTIQNMLNKLVTYAILQNHWP